MEPEVVLERGWRSRRLAGWLRILILCWAAVCSHSVFSYHDFKRIGVDDGLPNATIYSVAQDKQGYIWLTSTNSGLLRYDGYTFTEFPLLSPAEHQQVGNQDVGVLLIDNNNTLWAGTWGYGLSRIDGVSGKLRRIVADESSENALAGMYIQTLMQDKDGAVWVGTTLGLNKINPDGSIIRIGGPTSAQPLINQRIWSLAQTEDGTVWIGTAQGLHSYQQSSGLSQALKLYPDAVPQSRDNEIRALTTRNNELWLGGRDALFRLQQGKLQQVPFFPEQQSPIINVLRFDADNKLLVGTYNGMFRVDPELLQFVPFREQQSLLPNVNVRSIFLDRTGVLWLGSRESGLYFARHNKSAFSSLENVLPALATDQFDFTATSVFADNNIIWLGSADHLYRIDRQKQNLTRYATGGRVNSIRLDNKGQLYAATDVGLYLYNTELDAIRKITTPFTLASSSDGNIRDLQIEQDGRFWFGLWGEGVLAWDPESDKVVTYLKEEMRQKVGDAVQAMLLKDKILWVGSRYSGLLRIDTNTGAVIKQSLAGLKLPSDDVQCVESGPAGAVLLCTSKGLIVYQPDSKTQQHFHSGNGLPSDNIVGAYTDSKQNIWLLSAKGLTLRPVGTERFITFTRQDGMVATELAFKSIFEEQSGQLLVGTIGGMALIEPELLWVNDRVPQVAVSHVLVNNKSLPAQPHTAQWPLVKLTPADNSVEFVFASLDYHDVSRNQFMVRLKGFDKDWILHSGKNSAYYSNLPSGDYLFEVRGSNNHGLFSDQSATVRLVVEPPWWQHRPVQGALLFLLLMLMLGFHQYRLRHIRQINKLLQNSVQERAKAQLILETKVAERTKALEDSSLTLSLRTKQLEKSLLEIAKTNKELTRLDKLKDEFISTVSHELRTPLTSIRGAVGLIAQKVVQPDSEPYQLLVQTALNNCERLSNLINDLLDVQKFDAGKFVLQLTELDLEDAAQQAMTALKTYSDKYHVTLLLKTDLPPDGDNTSTPQSGHGRYLVMADPLRIRQVLDNLLSNAIKFSHPGGQVEVMLSSDGKQVKVAVTDEGIGIPAAFQHRVFEKFSQADASDSRAKEGTGLGLTICKRIIESHEGQIGFQSVEQQGATFWFSLPVASKDKALM